MSKTFTALGLAAAAAITMPSAAAAQDAAEVAVAPAAAITADKPCELQVWPTENYLGIEMGLLSGFGALGALADHERTKGSVTTIKDLMREFLGPDIQMEELEKLDYITKLGLDPERYEVVMHQPTPWNEDLKKNPELKAATKEFNRKVKKDERVGGSDNACYAELITTHIFYHKAMMDGSNLFTGWIYREFDGDTVVSTGTGQVKNPLEEFPPKDETMIEPARLELRDAYSKDFSEWVVKKSGV